MTYWILVMMLGFYLVSPLSCCLFIKRALFLFMLKECSKRRKGKPQSHLFQCLSQALFLVGGLPAGLGGFPQVPLSCQVLSLAQGPLLLQEHGRTWAKMQTFFLFLYLLPPYHFLVSVDLVGSAVSWDQMGVALALVEDGSLSFVWLLCCHCCILLGQKCPLLPSGARSSATHCSHDPEDPSTTSCSPRTRLWFM